MLKSYLLIALRSLRKQKMFSVINLLGMAVGMAFFALFALMAGAKLNADRFHQKADRLYCLIQLRSEKDGGEKHTTFVPGPLGEALRSDFPEIQATTRILPAGRVTLQYGEASFYETRALFVDPNFFQVFSFPLVQGDPDTVLSRPDSLVISERAAAKYFGDKDPLGQVLNLSGRVSLTVRGVSRNLPRTSSFGFEFLLSHEAASSLYSDLESWQTQRHTLFILGGPGFETQDFENKMPGFIARRYSDSPEAPQRIYVKLFRDFRLQSHHIESLLASTLPASVFITFGMGFLVLLVVSINFVNLSTARSMSRSREIGMRKVIGASRRQLVQQFLGESLLLAFLALPAAVLFYEMLHPVFYAYMGDLSVIAHTSAVSNSIWNYPFLWKYLVAAAVMTGLLSGIYPALVMSSFKPLQVLSGKLSPRRTKKRGSKALVVVQFFLAVLFIAAASIIRNQSGHFVQGDLGYNRERVAVIQLSEQTRPQREVLKSKISNFSSVKQVTAAAALPLVWENLQPVRPASSPEEENLPMHIYGVDYDFIKTLEIPLREGRAFSRSFSDRHSFILSREAARKLDWEDPIGRELNVEGKNGIVVGVVEDFLFADIGFSFPPAVLYLEPEALDVMLVRYSGSDSFPELKSNMQEQWLSVFPHIPFECRTLDENFSLMFRILTKVAGLLTGIGLVVMALSCLGILGLVSFLVDQRTKEIGIRRVLGAPAAKILWRILKEYLFLVLAADVLALGFLIFAWHQVLKTGLLFVTQLSVGTYVYSLAFTLAAAALAVLARSWRAAHANPAESLRYE